MESRKCFLLSMMQTETNGRHSNTYVSTFLLCQRQPLSGGLIHCDTKYGNWWSAVASDRTIIFRLSVQELFYHAYFALHYISQELVNDKSDLFIRISLYKVGTGCVEVGAESQFYGIDTFPGQSCPNCLPAASTDLVRGPETQGRQVHPYSPPAALILPNGRETINKL